MGERIGNASGRILVVFLVIAALLLTSLAAISTFLFQKEVDKRKIAELSLGQFQEQKTKILEELEQLRKDKIRLEGKNKEVEEKLNSSLDEIELQEGLRTEIKSENVKLREQLEQEKKAREEASNELSKSQEAVQKYEELKKVVEVEMQQKEGLTVQIKSLAERNKKLENNLADLERKILEVDPNYRADNVSKAMKVADEKEEKIDLATIVVAPATIPEGRVLAVDTDAEFLIVNLGEKDGLKVSTVMSIYRGKDYLGDVQVTRLQPEMAAADFIPPFSSKLVRKNDQVVVK